MSYCCFNGKILNKDKKMKLIQTLKLQREDERRKITERASKIGKKKRKRMRMIRDQEGVGGGKGGGKGVEKEEEKEKEEKKE